MTGHASPRAQANEDPKGPNMEQLPHVSEEAAATSRVKGEGGPDVERGTPVGEVSRCLAGMEKTVATGSEEADQSLNNAGPAR